MKALIIDRDEMATQLLQGKLESLGCSVVCEDVKNDALERLKQERFDLIFLDPAPLTTARPIVMDVRREVGSYSYIFLCGESVDAEAALKDGVNDVLQKPLQLNALEEKVENAERFCQFFAHIKDDSEDFPSAGGVISKSAFAQLFLSGVDRADRYAERSYVLVIKISNYKEVLDLDGAYGADYSVAKLSQHLVLHRRQSDIVGQTGKNEFSLLLLRPMDEAEPVDAANRIAQALGGTEFSGGQALGPIEILITLFDVPAASKIIEHKIVIERGV